MQQEHLRPVPSDGDQPKDTRARPRSRTARPLPTDRLKFESQVAALRVIGLDSQNGTRAVTSEDIGTRLSVATTTAGLNNNFFVSAGLVTKVGKGKYKPEPAVVEFARKHSFDAVAAGRLLGPLMHDAWFFTQVKQQLAHGPTNVRQMIEVLASAAGAAADRQTQLGLLLDWMDYAGLISTKDGTVTLVGAQKATTVEEHPTEEPEDVERAPADPAGETATKKPGRTAPQAKPPMLAFAFEFSLMPDDLAALSPEQITALFEAVGKVAAVKAALQG